MNIKVVSFTAKGAVLGLGLRKALTQELVECYARGFDPSLTGTELTRFVQQAMADSDGIVFIGAMGIAVRAIAPYLQGKDKDPAVVVIDENGEFVVSVLSGHLGGANALTLKIAQSLGAQSVITTATDTAGVFAVDVWAQEQHCSLSEHKQIQKISSALLAGRPVGFYSAYPIKGKIPHGLVSEAQIGISVSIRTDEPHFADELRVIPQTIIVGIGCRKGIRKDTVLDAIDQAVALAKVDKGSLAGAATIELKKGETGLLAACDELKLSLFFFSGEQLQAVPGSFSASSFVKETVGVDNVCERAAVLAAKGGKLILSKTIWEGVTVSLAEIPWCVTF